jgi:hypothetical protein
MTKGNIVRLLKKIFEVHYRCKKCFDVLSVFIKLFIRSHD